MSALASPSPSQTLDFSLTAKQQEVRDVFASGAKFFLVYGGSRSGKTFLTIYTLIDVPHISQVHIFYRAELIDLDFAAGEESLEVRLFDEQQIPWSELAFPTIGRTLECYFADRATQHFPVRNEPLAALRAHHKKA